MKISRVQLVSRTKTSLVFVETFPKHYHVPVHTHRKTESFMISKGSGYLYTDGELFVVKEGMKVDIAPGVHHGLYTRDEPLECVVTLEGEDEKEIAMLYRMLIRQSAEVLEDQE